MKEITIDCDNICSMAQIHDVLSRELALPHWYGRNLDALHDCLTSLQENLRITLLHVSALPFPAAGLLRVLRDSELENPHLEITLVTG